MKSLGNCLNFLNCADIFKKTVAFLFCLQRQDRLKKSIRFFAFQFRIISHDRNLLLSFRFRTAQCNYTTLVRRKQAAMKKICRNFYSVDFREFHDIL